MALRKISLIHLGQNFNDNGLKVGRAEDVNVSALFNGEECEKVYYSSKYVPIVKPRNIFNHIDDLKQYIINHGGEIIPFDEQVEEQPITPSSGSGSGSEEEPQVDVLQGAKILCKYNITNSDVSQKRELYHQKTSSGSGSGSGEVVPMFSSMEVDGEEISVTNEYIFDTTGEHTVLFTLLEGETSIGEQAFMNCSNLISVTIGNSVTSIGNSAFSGCSNLTSITIPNSVTSFGVQAFYECSGLTSITIPNSLTSIEERAFNSCSGLTSITIPDSVTSIGNAAFIGCTGLTSITIPDSVTSIDSTVFWGCWALTSITCNATTAPTIKWDTFQNISSTSGGTLTVPAGSTGYDVWMKTDDYYLGKYNWTKVEA